MLSRMMYLLMKNNTTSKIMIIWNVTMSSRNGLISVQNNATKKSHSQCLKSMASVLLFLVWDLLYTWSNTWTGVSLSLPIDQNTEVWMQENYLEANWWKRKFLMNSKVTDFNHSTHQEISEQHQMTKLSFWLTFGDKEPSFFATCSLLWASRFKSF